MRFVPVASSSIRALAYDESQLLMQVEFQDGEIYEYSGIHQTAYAQLLASPSVGQYFNAHIRSGALRLSTCGRCIRFLFLINQCSPSEVRILAPRGFVKLV